MMNNNDFKNKLIDIAKNYKTLYVKGCFGAPLNAKNSTRYSQNCAYNKRADRSEMIWHATNDTFGFDCVCLIKGVLWGWCGDADKVYGGAKYASNGVPDIGEDAMIKRCRDVSTDFANIVPGEMLWTNGHAGVYVGDGLVVECSPAWANKVQITACNRDIAGYKRRNWAKHGKLPWIDYVTYVTTETYRPSVLEWQQAAIADGFKFPKYGADGEWGTECEGVAKKAVVKRRLFYTHKNLTKIVQRVVGVTVDGKYGNDTKKAVIVYQKANDLVPDGEVGINTWKIMLGV